MNQSYIIYHYAIIMSEYRGRWSCFSAESCRRLHPGGALVASGRARAQAPPLYKLYCRSIFKCFGDFRFARRGPRWHGSPLYYAEPLAHENGIAKPDAEFPELYEVAANPKQWARRYLVPDFTSKLQLMKFAVFHSAILWWDDSDGREIEYVVFRHERGQSHRRRIWESPCTGRICCSLYDEWAGWSCSAQCILLNNEFTGGGVEFTRDNCSCNATIPGFLMIHPGKVTHNHKRFPITDGTRYVLVSFNS
jgi:hypothetical protein